MKPRKIAFFGLFGQQNLGNDCTLQAVLHHVRRYCPDAELMCSCTGPDEVSASYNIATFPIRIKPASSPVKHQNVAARLMRMFLIRVPRELFHWASAFRALKGTDVVIAPGTGLLVDHTTGPFGIPYDVFKWSILAKLRRCKLLFVSVGAGPISHPLSKWLFRFGLSLADYRSYRDSFSRAYLKNIGLDTRDDPIFPDLAFSLPNDMLPELRNCDSHKPVVGIGLMGYHSKREKRGAQQDDDVYRDFIGKLGALANWCVLHDYTVRTLIGDVRYDSKVKQDLFDLLGELGLAGQNIQIIDEEIGDLRELLLQIAKSDIVVSPRFHNIILALMLNKPVISISYNEKFEFLMNEMKLSGYCQSIDKLDVDKIIEQFVDLEKTSQSHKAYIKIKSDEYRRSLDRQYDAIFGELLVPNRHPEAVVSGGARLVNTSLN